MSSISESVYPARIGMASMGMWDPNLPTETHCECGRVILGTLGTPGACPKCELARAACKCEWTEAKANYERTRLIPDDPIPMSAWMKGRTMRELLGERDDDDYYDDD